MDGARHPFQRQTNAGVNRPSPQANRDTSTTNIPEDECLVVWPPLCPQFLGMEGAPPPRSDWTKKRTQHDTRFSVRPRRKQKGGIEDRRQESKT